MSERGRMTEYGPLLPPPGAQLRPLGEVSLDVDAEKYWWCECPDAGDVGPHVHCPWGGMHVHLIDPETGIGRQP